MIPQLPGVLDITSLSVAPKLNTSLTVDLAASIGTNQINRLVGRSVNFYSGVTSNDQTLTIGVATVDSMSHVVTPTFYEQSFPTPTQAFILQVTSPVICRVTVNNITTELPVTKLLAIDSPVKTIRIINGDQSLAVQAKLTYLI